MKDRDVSIDLESAADPARTRSPIEYTIASLALRILIHRKRIVRLCLLGGLVMAVWSELSGPHYTAKVSFLPASGASQISSLAGIAAQFGVNVPGGADAGQSPDFYADLLVSDRTLRDLASARYRILTGRGGVTDTSLVDYLTPGFMDPAVKMATTLRKLRGHLATETGPNTGVVTLRVTLDDPLLATEVAGRAVTIVNRFNVEGRQTQARAQREFLSTQLTQAGRDLKSAEDSLLQFLVANRDYHNSPTLSFQYDRLQRSVAMRQDAYTQVFQAYLQAQASEVQNTPVITVVEAPVVPAVADPRRRIIRTLLGALIAFVLTLTWLSVSDGAGQLMSGDAEVNVAVGAARADVAALRSRVRAIALMHLWGRRRADS